LHAVWWLGILFSAQPGIPRLAPTPQRDTTHYPKPNPMQRQCDLNARRGWEVSYPLFTTVNRIVTGKCTPDQITDFLEVRVILNDRVALMQPYVCIVLCCGHLPCLPEPTTFTPNHHSIHPTSLSPPPPPPTDWFAVRG